MKSGASQTFNFSQRLTEKTRKKYKKDSNSQVFIWFTPNEDKKGEEQQQEEQQGMKKQGLNLKF